MNPSKRSQLFKVFCMSLFTGTTGFSSQPLSSLLSSQQQLSGAVTSLNNDAPANSLLLVERFHDQGNKPGTMTRLAAKRSKGPVSSIQGHDYYFYDNQPLLTAEEEAKLLQQAVEGRRLNQIERDLTLKSPTRELPLLYVRAKAAGYGEEDILAYEEAVLQGQKARETLVTRNIRLVHHCVRQILKKRPKLNSLSYDDLIQEGSIGLARAVDRWNPEIGGRFSTYAVYWVRAAIFRCIAERDDMLRVPDHVSQAIRDVNKAARHLGIDLNASSQTSSGMSAFMTNSKSWKQAEAAKKLAEQAGLSENKFNEAMKVRNWRYTGGYVAFESWMQFGEDLHSDVPIPRSSASSSSSTLETEHLRTTLSKFLRPKEMEALSWRYGLVDDDTVKDVFGNNNINDNKNMETKKERANRYLAEAEEELFGGKQTTTTTNKPSSSPSHSSIPSRGRWGEAMTFTEVGNRMHVSAEYGRKLCHAALTKLQRAAEEGQLEPALLF